MIYTVQGYTGPRADFTCEIDLADNFDWNALRPCGDPRYNAAYNALKIALLESDCPAEYLDLYDLGCFDERGDLAEHPSQRVLVGNGFGCDNCESELDTEWCDGCDDSPHGTYMLTFEAAK